MSLLFIVGGTLIAGASNSLLTKYQDQQCVRHCLDPDVTKHRNFEQPAIQTLQMFLGEMAVYFAYLIIKWLNARKRRAGYRVLEEEEETQSTSLWKNFQLALPSICDICATTLFNIGLVYTPVSIYQMTRGSSVLFVAMMSVIFLKKKVTKLEWISLLLVSLGVAIVGFSGSKESDSNSDSGEAAPLVVLGITLIIIASVFQACQFVVEEFILSKHNIPPLQLVYYEGFFGTTILFTVMIVLNFILGSIQNSQKFEDSPFNLVQSFTDVFNSRAVVVTSLLIMVSIALFNFCGISLTHRLSATSRSTVDTCRTFLVWLLALVMGWESFSFLQFLGFAVLVVGTLCYNGVLTPEDWHFVPVYLKSERETANDLE